MSGSLIYVDDLLQLIQKEYEFHYSLLEATEEETDKNLLRGMVIKLLWCIKKVGKAPTIDAVEVVRCKHCQHRKTCKHTRALGINGYCSDGEKKHG